jgi:hypothetical protein
MLRLVLIIASIANATAGLALAGLWYSFRHDEGMPVIVLFVGLSLLVQGAFTITEMRGLWKRWGNISFQLFVTGEAAAALVGGVAILQGVLYNLHPINGDYEFGPLTAATLMTTQATIGLVYAARNSALQLRGRSSA